VNLPDELVNVRYMVNDVQESIDFYTEHFAFELRSSAAPAFRNEIVTGPGGRQILIDDPSGNPIELFQPARK
jgi:predicted enzyme related to lactoylglutathione lyase